MSDFWNFSYKYKKEEDPLQDHSLYGEESFLLFLKEHHFYIGEWVGQNLKRRPFYNFSTNADYENILAEVIKKHQSNIVEKRMN